MNVKRLKSLCIEISKTINDMNQYYLKEIFELAVKQRPVRQQHIYNLKTISVRTTTFGTKSLTVLRPTVWNKLPAHLKTAKNLVDFKKLIKEWDGESCSCLLCHGH